MYECFHASTVWEDQCNPTAVVLPSAREINGSWGEDEVAYKRVAGELCGRCVLNESDANGTRGHRNQFRLLKQMRATQPRHGVCSSGSFWPPPSLLKLTHPTQIPNLSAGTGNPLLNVGVPFTLMKKPSKGPR